MFSLATLIWVLLIGYLAWRSPDKVAQLLTMVLPTYLLRLTIFGIPTTWLELAIYVIFIIWLWRKYLRGRWWQPILLYWQPLVLIGIGLIIGTVVSTNLFLSLGIIKGWFVDPLIVFLLISNSVSLRFPGEGFNYTVVGLWFSGVVLALVALYQVISGNFITIDHRASSLFSSANYLSLYLVPVMILITGLWHQKYKQKWVKWLFGFGWAIMLLALFFTFSYAGWLGLLVGLGIFWWFSSSSPKPFLWWLLGIGIVIASQWQMPKFQQMLDLAGRSSSHVRLQVWQTALLIIKEHWFTGIGLGLFEKRYLEFATKIFNPPIELIMLHSHNIFLQFWVNTGVIGLVGFIWLISIFFSKIWRAVVSKNPLAVATFSAMVALLMHGLFDMAYWKNDLSALFWIIIALGGILSNQTNGRQELSHRD